MASEYFFSGSLLYVTVVEVVWSPIADLQACFVAVQGLEAARRQDLYQFQYSARETGYMRYWHFKMHRMHRNWILSETILLTSLLYLGSYGSRSRENFYLSSGARKVSCLQTCHD